MTESEFELHRRIDTLEGMLERVLDAVGAKEEAQWIERTEMAGLLGVSLSTIAQLMAEGVFSAESLRNVGTVKKPRYRFHKTKAMNAFLARTA